MPCRYQPVPHAARLNSLSAAARVRREQRSEQSGNSCLEAIAQDRPGGRIRVKASDGYSAHVEILSNYGPRCGKGTRLPSTRTCRTTPRDRSFECSQGRRPPSALDQFRGKTIGGHASHQLTSREPLIIRARGFSRPTSIAFTLVLTWPHEES